MATEKLTLTDETVPPLIETSQEERFVPAVSLKDILEKLENGAKLSWSVPNFPSSEKLARLSVDKRAAVFEALEFYEVWEAEQENPNPETSAFRRHALWQMAPEEVTETIFRELKSVVTETLALLPNHEVLVRPFRLFNNPEPQETHQDYPEAGEGEYIGIAITFWASSMEVFIGFEKEDLSTDAMFPLPDRSLVGLAGGEETPFHRTPGGRDRCAFAFSVKKKGSTLSREVPPPNLPVQEF